MYELNEDFLNHLISAPCCHCEGNVVSAEFTSSSGILCLTCDCGHNMRFQIVEDNVEAPVEKKYFGTSHGVYFEIYTRGDGHHLTIFRDPVKTTYLGRIPFEEVLAFCNERCEPEKPFEERCYGMSDIGR